MFALPIVVAAACLASVSARVQATSASDGGLRVEVVTAYNLVVDSNVESPSTYAPRAAYLGATYYNDSTETLTNVFACIGNYLDGVSDTPGIYPSRPHPPLAGFLTGPGYDPAGEFALTHEGGSIGLSDATRYLGTIEPGGSRVVYWLISYPNLDANGDAVWGPSVKPDDDLWLEYDIWGTANEAGTDRTAVVTRTVTMRNEISAMANKILPNTANKVPQEYQDLLAQYEPSWSTTNRDGTVGTRIYAEGIWYDLGNIGQGFDNNGDLVPDYNAWMQPVGDPTVFDPGSFRLIHTYAMVVVKMSTGGEQVYFPEDQLYFENIPVENNGAVGWVRYEFMALETPTASQLSPYQEVASGYDNEKFNGDYGQTLGVPLISYAPRVEMSKTASVATVALGGTIQYAVTYSNSGALALGDPIAGVPVVLSDSIPKGTHYVAGTARSSNVLPPGVDYYSVLYSTDNGVSWLTAEPAQASNVTDIQWWLSDLFPTSAVGTVRFSVTVDNPYLPPDPLIVNTGKLSFGSSPPVLEDDAETLVLGNNSLGDTVFRDDGSGSSFGNGFQNTSEDGIVGITVDLYFDLNGNGTLETTDLFLGTTATAAAGHYSFTSLPDGKYLAVVDWDDPQVPTGYTLTTPEVHAVDLDSARSTVNPVNYLDADFGFAPALTLDKTLTSSSPLYEGGQVTYRIDVVNHLPGDGSGTGRPATYAVWGATYDAANSGTGIKAWTPPENAANQNGPDGLYALTNLEDALEKLAVTDFRLGTQPGAITNVKLLVALRVTGIFPVKDEDKLTVTIIERLNPGNVVFTASYFCYNLTSGQLVIDVTSARAWQWADFNSSTYSILLLGDKGGGPDTGNLEADAVGFRITSDEMVGTGTSSTTLQPVPLTDRFDTNDLEFVSAIPSQTGYSTSGSTGILQWADIGPIYPGGTSSVSLVFNVLEPPNNQSGIVTNTAFVNEATFQTGWPANDATDRVQTVVLPTGSIGDFVWRDLDSDGVQDGGNEQGIAGVQVRLTPPAGVDIGAGPGNPVTTVTDRYGMYLFERLPASGNYTVAVIATTLPGGSGVNTYDEDGGTGSPNNQTVVNLDHDATNGADNHLTADFGYRVPTTIDGLIWHDMDQSADATRDTGEPWLANVTVYLCAGSSPCGAGSALATTQTDANGYFRFVGNYAGTYNVSVNTSIGPLATGTWFQSFDTDGIGTLHYATTSVVTGGTAHLDYSYYQTGSYGIGDTLFYDWNGDAVQQTASEEGIAEITVYLYNDADGDGVLDAGQDAFIASDVTDADGKYFFPNRPAGNYLVVADESDPQFPSGYTQTLDPDETGVAQNPDGQGVVALSATRLDIDFGYQPTGSGSIGDTVWRDLNGDGFQAGPLETGISGITARLFVDLNGDGTYVEIDSATTDISGKYLFANLPDGAYRVVVDTSDPQLPSDGFGEPYIPTTATLAPVTILNGNDYLDADFGFAPPAAVGDTIFWDANGNGTQDWNENGITNVTVNLYRDLNGNRVYDAGDEWVGAEQTDTNGLYVFTGLLPDAYVVAVDQTAGPVTNATMTADPDNDGLPCGAPGTVNCDGQVGITLRYGQSFMGADFGYEPPGVIGDTLWIDTDGDGMRDSTEFGISYITVELRRNGVLVATTETDADGYYLFDHVPDGSYEVVVVATDLDFPADLAQTYDPDGTLDDEGSPIVLTNGTVVLIGTNACTGCSLDVDFGYRYSGSNVLSGTVGLDGPELDGVLGNSDSGVNANESPFPRHSLFLYLWDDDGDGVVEAGETTLIGSTTTTANGDYRFENLPAGDGNDRYIVSLAAPASRLYLTTTVASATPALLVSQTTNAVGEALSAYQAVPVVPVTTNVDFAFRLTVAFDFGDLPQTYSTQLGDAPSGARHMVPATPNLYLGTTVDTEANGQPTANASGDGADEDGVQAFGGWQDGPDGGWVRVTVGAGSGWLVGWMDFDHSGDFTGPGEMVINQAVSAGGGGVYAIRFDIPNGSIVGETVFSARFRLFPSQPAFPAAAFTGEASGGEAEDYQFRVRPTFSQLARFEAVARGDDVVVIWETTLQMETLGFYLRRFVPAAGAFVPVHNEMIWADPFAYAGEVYEVVDPGASPGGTYTYLLVEEEVDGTLLTYGPYTVTVDGGALGFDNWRALYFTAAEIANAAVGGPDADPDGDGHTNAQEFLAGTDPRDPLSVLRITAAEIDRGDDRVIRWNSSAGRAYSLERAARLPDFSTVEDRIEATPPCNSYTDRVDTAGAVFYRVKLVP